MTSPSHSAFAPGSVTLVLGTRPEVIKLAPLVRLLGDAVRIVHTGQHFDSGLSAAFFDELGVPEPAVQYAVGGRSRGSQIGEVITALDVEFDRHRPAAVIVQGDTNAVVAASMAANARSVPLVHLEAGLRSFDRRMPEEHNRVVADHLADLCLAATSVNVDNLAAEGIAGQRVALTGNTIVDAVNTVLASPEERAQIVSSYGVVGDGFVLATIHRPENTDDPDRLTAILEQLGALPLPVVFPMHPRTADRIATAGLGQLLAPLRVVEPVDHSTFLALLSAAAVTVSDSGGVQEEVTVVKRPAVIVRRSTERPEVIGSFTDLVSPGPDIGIVVQRWLDEGAGGLERLRSIDSPYGDGDVAARCVAALADLLDES